MSLTLALLPTSSPIYEVVPMSKPVGDVAILHDGALWLIDESEAHVQVVPLAEDDTQLPQTLSRSNDGSWLAWLAVSVGEQEAANREKRNLCCGYPVVLNLSTGELRRYYDVSAVPQAGLTWSAAGQTIYFKPYNPTSRAQGILSTLDVTTGVTQNAVVIAEPGIDTLVTGDLALTADGSLLFAVMYLAGESWKRGSAAIMEVETATGASKTIADTTIDPIPFGEWIYTKPWDVLRLPMALSPQGDAIAYSVGSGIDPDARVADIWGLYLVGRDGGTPQRVATDWGLDRPLWSPDGSNLAVAGGVGDGSVFLIYQTETQEVIYLTDDQWRQANALVNPRRAPLNLLRLLPVAWLSEQRLVIRAVVIGEGAVGASEALLSIDLANGEIALPPWYAR